MNRSCDELTEPPNRFSRDRPQRGLIGDNGASKATPIKVITGGDRAERRSTAESCGSRTDHRKRQESIGALDNR
jgi:ABC-type Mn2+/Zn2+ transport system ATPase subunit